MRVPIEYFDALYAHDPDPWGFDRRWYERRKHALTVAALPRGHYRRALEVGCSTGRLTSLLAARCERVVAVDTAAVAVEAARKRLRGIATVALQRQTVPDEWPAGRFDLVVLSEVLYYFAGADLNRLTDLAVGCLEDEGTLIAVHWRHRVADHAVSGDSVHRRLQARPELCRLVRHIEADFLLEVYLRTETGRSVAELEGLVRPGSGAHL